ncbi:hypothetical protein HRG_014064 [Hirsutella rhossiliensis]
MGQTFKVKLLAPHARLAKEYWRQWRNTFSRLRQGPRQAARRPRGLSPASEVTATVAVKRKADAEPSKSPPRLRKKTKCGSHAPNSQPATLSGLPTELHQLIFFHIEYIEDVVSLGFVNQRLYDIAREETEQDTDREAEAKAPWRHQRIIATHLLVTRAGQERRDVVEFLPHPVHQ